MYQKYRVFIQTSRGGYFAAASNSVNGLAPMVANWLENTSVGRSITDIYDTIPGKNGGVSRKVFSHSDVQSVNIYVYDRKQGDYVRSSSLPADDRKDIIKKIRLLGAR